MNGPANVDPSSSNPNYASVTRPAQDFAQTLQQHSDADVSKPKPARDGRPAPGQPPALPKADEVNANSSRLDNDVDALADRTFHQTSLSLDHIVTPIGITEAFLGARVYGLHQAAQGYLSELGTQDDATTPKAFIATPMQASMADSITDAPERDVPTFGVSLFAEDVSTASPSIALVSGRAPAGLTELTSSTDVASTPVLTATSDEALQWSERVLRVGRDGGKGVTAWLRDYRLSEAELTALLTSLTTHAREQGMALQRIVLNGREVWTSAEITSKGNLHAS